MWLWIFGVVRAMVCVGRIEMPASRRKGWSFAFAGHVDVHGMLSGREILQAEIDFDPLASGSIRKLCGPDFLTHRILQRHRNRFIGGKQNAPECTNCDQS